MARTNEAEVLEIMDTNLTEGEIAPHVLAANLFVTARLSGQGLSDTLLREIERWVAAHFACAREKQVKSETVGGASATYQMGAGTVGLATTMYGERALMLDSTGYLAGGGKRRAGIEALDIEVKHDP